MENPFTWDKATVEINNAYLQWLDSQKRGEIGLSVGAYLAKQLAASGYLTQEAMEPVSP